MLRLPLSLFAPIQGVAIEVGCSAPHSVVKLDNTIFWLGSNDRGGVVYRADGYSPLRVSTHAVEWQIQQYADISDAVAYAYQQEGHAFYVLNFPSACTTWVYDVATGAWHERASFRDGLFKRHRSNSHCSFNGATVVGDYNNGNLYLMDVDLFADPIGTQKWLRSWRALPRGETTSTAPHIIRFSLTVKRGLYRKVTRGPNLKSGSVGQTTGGIHGQTTTASQRGALGTTGTVYTGEGWG